MATRKVGNGLDLASQRIINLGDPSSGTDAANKQYVDGVASGLKWKSAVRAATTANGTLASAYENADVIDGVTLATGDRILLKNQTAGAENGIYTVNASGAPTRATDFDANSEVSQATVFVQEGTVNADTAWTMTNNGAITLGTTALVFAQFGGGGVYTAGNGLGLSGGAFSVTADTGIAVTGSGVKIDTAVVVRKFAVSIGNGSLTSITVTHNLGTLDVTVGVFDNGTGDEIIADVNHATTNTVTVVFAVAPTTNQYRVVVHG